MASLWNTGVLFVLTVAALAIYMDYRSNPKVQEPPTQCVGHQYEIYNGQGKLLYLICDRYQLAPEKPEACTGQDCPVDEPK